MLVFPRAKEVFFLPVTVIQGIPLGATIHVESSRARLGMDIGFLLGPDPETGEVLLPDMCPWVDKE